MTATGASPSAPPVRGPRPDHRMPHLPGLDGLRGLAVIGVLLFHGGFVWAKGGFLGVSTFFTLSGFLITNLLIREWDGSGTIRLGGFWTRRFRRLLPAAMLTIVLVGVVFWRIGTPAQLANLRGDMVSSLAYVANWHFLFAGTSYADLFSAPSPLQHFWSLAIEEQFYLVFPLLVLGVARIGGRRLLTTVLLTLTTASVILSVALGSNIDRVYYGTDTRAAELLIGALLALWWSGRREPAHARVDHDRLTVGADIAGVVALAAVFLTWGLASETSTRLARGGFALYAVATAAIIFAATRPGLVTRALSWKPLRWAGLISYGLYLYHWPIFLVLSPDRVHWPLLPLFVLRMAVTIPIALVSYHFLEMPIRRTRMLVTRRAALSAVAVGAATAVCCAVLVTMHPPQSQVPYANAKIGDSPMVVASAPVSATTPSTTADPSASSTTTIPGVNADTVMILGDSGTVDAQPALEAAFYASGTTKVVDGAAPGFGLTSPLFHWRTVWPQEIAQYKPDLIVMMMGGWDYKFIQQHGTDAYVPYVDEVVHILTAGGAKVLWTSMLPGGSTPDRLPDKVYSQLPTKYPGQVAYADIAYSLQGTSPGDYPRTIPGPNGETLFLRKKDDWHLCQEGASRVAAAINKAAYELGWSHLAPYGWQAGSWRSSPVFDDPHGTCT